MFEKFKVMAKKQLFSALGVLIGGTVLILVSRLLWELIKIVYGI